MKKNLFFGAMLLCFALLPFITHAQSENDFVTTWRLSEADKSITIPTVHGGYEYYVNWGDGASTTFQGPYYSSVTYHYPTAGEKTIRIKGKFPRIFFFGYGSEREKIRSVDQWGNIAWESMYGAFTFCRYLDIEAEDKPDLSGVTEMYIMFQGAQNLKAYIGDWNVSNVVSMERAFEYATSFNQPLHGWNVSKATNMYAMFRHANSFNQDLGNWNLKSIRDMRFMLDFTALSVENYEATLEGWNANNNTPNGMHLGVYRLKYCDESAGAARSKLINSKSWFVDGDRKVCGEQKKDTDFVTTWRLNFDGETVYIPTFGGGYEYYVDWYNDGTFEGPHHGDIKHRYDVAGEKTIRIRGDFPRIFFDYGGVTEDKIDQVDDNDNLDFFRAAKDKIISVDQWGNIVWAGMEHAFAGCSNLDIKATDKPDLSTVTNMAGMFGQASSLKAYIGDWNVSKVTVMESLFWQAKAFNQPLDDWNVSKVVNMYAMFQGATSFDQNLGEWDLKSIRDVRYMLDDAGLSIGNYDATLTGWNDNPNTPNNIPRLNPGDPGGFGAKGLKYCNAKDARSNLINNKWWVIWEDQELCSPKNYFITTWKTDNPGTSGNTEITIPVAPDVTYNYDVDWNNDGDFGGPNEKGHIGSATHDFGRAGTYKIAIRGVFPGIYFNNGGDKEKILSVQQWGTHIWSSMKGAFHGCKNLELEATDAPDLSRVTDMDNMFAEATAFNGNIGGWNVSRITKMSSMFEGASSFNQDLSRWDVSEVTTMNSMFKDATAFNQDLSDWNLNKVTDMNNMLDGSGLSVANYDATLVGWNTNPNTPNSITLGASGLEYCNAEVSRNNLLVTKGWTINGDSKVCPIETYFITTWKTTSNNEQITIPTVPGQSYDYDVDWNNDGDFDDPNEKVNTGGGATHTFPTAGNHRIAIRARKFPLMRFSNTGDKDKLISIDQWGAIRWDSMIEAFYGCTNLELKATDAPDLSNVITMTNMFRGATKFNGDIGHWNVSEVVHMGNMFRGATSFNQDLSNWNLNRVENMNSMFRGATAFNQDLSNWNNLNAVTDMNNMLDGSGLSLANYDATLIGWHANVNTPDDITLGASGLKYCDASVARSNLLTSKGWEIQGDIKECSPYFVTTWKTDAVTPGETTIIIPTVSGVIYNYDVDWNNDGDFDDPNEKGHTGDATHDFNTADTYQIGIRGEFPRIYFNNRGDKDKLLSVDRWGTNEWMSMERAFYGCTNLEIKATDAPDLSRVTDMSNMFRGATSFNGDLSNWNVSEVMDMSNMFRDATKFNQDLSNWNVSEVIDMSNMFRGATAFNQDLSNWNLNKVTDMNNMLDGSGLSPANYDATLIGWNTNVNTPNDVTLGASGLKYCNSKVSRSNLEITKGWTINGDSEKCPSTEDHFVTTWKTDAGTPGETTITIPAASVGIYNYDVDWNDDGVFDSIGMTESVTHDYDNAGEKTIRIRGLFPRINFVNESDKDKLLSVNQWGTIVWSGMERAFEGCTNLEVFATDAPDLSRVTDVGSMFSGATAFNQDINHWNVSLVTNMVDMFSGATAFNQDLSNWNVSEVINMSNMFKDATAFNQDLSDWNLNEVTDMNNMLDSSGLSVANYDATLIGWNANSNTPNGITLGAMGLNYCRSKAARDNLVSTATGGKSWTIKGDSEDCSLDDITLTSSEIAENAGANAIVGTLSTSPVIPSNTYTYTFTSGTGDTDNTLFNISGEELRANESFDFETKNSYSVRINVNDGTDDFSKSLTITVTDVNEAPTDIALSSTTIAENAGADAAVGILSATDDFAIGAYTFSFMSGTGDTDNTLFNISGTELRANESFDFETKNSYSVRINVNDGANDFAKSFTITVTNVKEDGDVNTVSGIKIYPNPVTDNVLNIQLLSGETIKKISLVDLQGRILAEVPVDIRQIDMRTYAGGVYVLKVETNSQTIVSKIVKE